MSAQPQEQSTQAPPPDEVSFEEAVEQLRRKFGVPKSIADRLINQESGGSDSATSPVGAHGRMQLMPGTAATIRKPDGSPIDINNPLENVYGGLKYLSDNYNQFKGRARNDKHAWALALAAYHAGPAAVEDALKGGGLGIPDRGDGGINTQDYVYDILSGVKPEDFGGAQAQPSPTVPTRDRGPANYSAESIPTKNYLPDEPAQTSAVPTRESVIPPPGAYRTGLTGERRAMESVNTQTGQMGSRGGVVRVVVTPQMSGADISYAAHRDLAARNGLDPADADAYAREVIGLQAEGGYFKHGDEFINKAREGGMADVEIADPAVIAMLNKRLAERHGEKVLGASASQGQEIPALVKGVESAFDSDEAKRFGYNGPPSGVTGVTRGALSTAGLAAKAGEKAYSLLDLMTLRQWNFGGYAEDARQNAEYWTNAVADLDAAHPTDLMDKLVGEAVTLPVPIAKAKLAGALLEEAAAKIGAKVTPAAVGAMLGIFDTDPKASPAEAVRHVVESGLLFKSFELTQGLGRAGHVAAQGALGAVQGGINEGTAEGAVKGAVTQAGFALADPAHTERTRDEGTFRNPLSIADERTARLSHLDMPDVSVPVNEGFTSPRVVQRDLSEDPQEWRRRYSDSQDRLYGEVERPSPEVRTQSPSVETGAARAVTESPASAAERLAEHVQIGDVVLTRAELIRRLVNAGLSPQTAADQVLARKAVAKELSPYEMRHRYVEGAAAQSAQEAGTPEKAPTGKSYEVKWADGRAVQYFDNLKTAETFRDDKLRSDDEPDEPRLIDTPKGARVKSDYVSETPESSVQEAIPTEAQTGTSTPRLPKVGDTIEYETGFPPRTVRGKVTRLQTDPVTKESVPIVRIGGGNEFPAAEWYDSGRVVQPEAAETPHHSEFQPRRQRNTATGSKGQFKEGKPETLAVEGGPSHQYAPTSLKPEDLPALRWVHDEQHPLAMRIYASPQRDAILREIGPSAEYNRSESVMPTSLVFDTPRGRVRLTMGYKADEEQGVQYFGRGGSDEGILLRREQIPEEVDATWRGANAPQVAEPSLPTREDYARYREEFEAQKKPIQTPPVERPSSVPTRGQALAAVVSSDPATVNAKTWYHGTGTADLTPEHLNPTVTKAEGLFGQGIYLTDSPEIAKGYAKNRGKLGTPTVYEAKVNVGNVLDLERPATPEVLEVYKRRAKSIEDTFGGDFEEFNSVANKSGVTGEELHRTLSEEVSSLSHDEMIPSGDFYEDFGILSEDLRKLGYDALTHTGGRRTGKPPHQVLILLDPNDYYGGVGRKGQVTSFAPVVEQSTPDAMKVPERDTPKSLPKSSVPTKAQAPSNQAGISTIPKRPFGPGAANVGDVPAESQMKQLTEAVRGATSPKQPLSERLNVARGIADRASATADVVTRGVTRLRAQASAMYDSLTKLPPFTDYQKSVGEWLGGNQKADHELSRFVKAAQKAVPDPARRTAITNYIQAGGDESVLRARADASTGNLKRGYEIALHLTEDEKTVATNISAYLDARLQEGIDAGLLDHGLDNYITQVWKKESPVTRKLQADVQTGKLQTNFKYARQRLFDSYFDGEQAGHAPASKDFSHLIAAYDQSFNRAISARGFVKHLSEGTARDGRPVVAVSGSGSTLPDTSVPEAVLIKPKSKVPIKPSKAELEANPDAANLDISDYRTIDHPALRKWKWVQSVDGKPVMIQGDLLVHPDHYQHLKNVLSSSAFRQNPIGKFVLNAQSTIKQLMMSLSGFHQVQEANHALGHRINPANARALNFDDPAQMALVTHGLQVADYNAASLFSEGLASGNVVNAIPVVGKRLLKPYTEYLFHDYIPRLKMETALHIQERNTARYAKELAAGTVTRDQLLELSARQANAAYGELNLKYMGRNPTLQDALRTFLLAPDFLEARARFVGQAVKPHGREQLIALGVLAATQFVGARILNKIFDDDWHWDRPFSFVYQGHEYGLRTVPGDILHLFKDPRGFVYNRLSPIAKTAVEGVTGRDERGVKRDMSEQIIDFLKTPMPISLRRHEDDAWWEPILNSLGGQEKKYHTPAEEMMNRLAADEMPSKPPAAEELKRFKAKKGFVEALRSGKQYADIKPDVDKALKGGTLRLTDIPDILRKRLTTPLEDKFKKLGIEDAIAVFQIMSQEERGQVIDELRRKRHLLLNIPENRRQAVGAKLNELTGQSNTPLPSPP